MATNLNRITTKRIKALLDDPYIRGVDGSDYEESKDELERILWDRERIVEEKRLKKELKELEQYELEQEKAEKNEA